MMILYKLLYTYEGANDLNPPAYHIWAIPFFAYPDIGTCYEKLSFSSIPHHHSCSGTFFHWEAKTKHQCHWQPTGQPPSPPWMANSNRLPPYCGNIFTKQTKIKIFSDEPLKEKVRKMNDANSWLTWLRDALILDQWLGKFWGTIHRNLSVSKSNRLHVHIFQFSCVKLGYVSWNPLKWWVVFLKSWTSTGSYVTSNQFSPFIALDHSHKLIREPETCERGVMI